MKQTKRMINLDLLRIVAMTMVVVLHYLGKGNLLPALQTDFHSVTGVVAWLLEAFCIVAVNLYMLISGYVLAESDYKPSRLIRLYGQVWFYSVFFGVLAALAGIVAGVSVDVHYLLTLVFPISMGHYWFMTAYVFLFLLLPFVGLAIRKMTKPQMQIALAGLFLAFSLLKSVVPMRMEMDGKGYDVLWYLCVFVAAAYVKRFGLPVLEKKSRALLLYIASVLVCFGFTMALHLICAKTGKFALVVGLFMEYNHLFVFLGALGLMMLFLQMSFAGVEEKPLGKGFAALVRKVAPHTLAVYLIHENIGLRYVWQNCFLANRVNSVFGLFLGTVVAVFCVFACGILVDCFRALLVKLCHKALSHVALYNKVLRLIEGLDEKCKRG